MIKEKRMKKVMIAVCLGCLFLMANVASAIEVDASWPPAGWYLITQGTITNIQNTGPFNVEAFSIRVGGQAVWFNTTAPFASNKTFERAFKMALLFKAMGVEVQVWGTDTWNAVVIASVN